METQTFLTPAFTLVSRLCIKISKIPTEPSIIKYFSEHSSVCRKYIRRNELSSYSTCEAFINSWIRRSGSWEKSGRESSGKRAVVAGFRSTRPELECALKVVILCWLFLFFFFSSMDGERRGGLVWFEGHRFTTSFSLRLFHGVRTTGTSYESHNCQIPPPPFTVTTESSSWPRYFVVYSNDAVRTTA